MFLARLSQKHTLFLISKNEPTRLNTIESLGITKFFKTVLFVEEKSKGVFAGLGIDPKESLVVGDYLASEIRAGNDFGAITVRIRQGLFKDMVPANQQETPRHEIQTLQELDDIIRLYV